MKMTGTEFSSKVDSKSDNSLHVLALNKRSWNHSKAGGAEVNLEKTLKRLASKGHQIHLLTGSDGGRSKSEIDEQVIIKRVGFDNYMPAPLDIIISYLTITIYFYWYSYRLSPDIVYAVNSPLPWLIITRCPKVTIFHHIAIESFFDTHSFPFNILGSAFQWIGVYRERNNPTVSVSPSTTEDLISRGHDPDTIYEIRNGVNVNKYKPGSKSGSPRIVYIGGLERYKGVDRIPEIHKELQEKLESPVRLDVAGRDGQLKEKIRNYCDSSNDAYFHGFISEKRKIDMLKSSWVFIAPSRIEGWGIAILEANACGTPAVGANVKGLKDSILNEKTGLLVDGSNSKRFSAGVSKLLEQHETRRKYSERARSWSEQHSWKRTAEKHEKLFLSVRRGNK